MPSPFRVDVRISKRADKSPALRTEPGTSQHQYMLAGIVFNRIWALHLFSVTLGLTASSPLKHALHGWAGSSLKISHSSGAESLPLIRQRHTMCVLYRHIMWYYTIHFLGDQEKKSVCKSLCGRCSPTVSEPNEIYAKLLSWRDQQPSMSDLMGLWYCWRNKERNLNI